MINAQETVAKIVLDYAECAPVFARHRIDFGSRGDQSVEAAARARGVHLESLLTELTNAAAERSPEHGDPRTLSTSELVEHIVARHHEPLRQSLPVLRSLASEVARIHGHRNPALHNLQAVVEALAEFLVPHFEDEQGNLFPALLASEQDPGTAQRARRAMVEDHRELTRLLERVQVASDEFTLPPWACESYRKLFAELQRFESSIFAPVHLENHVLMSRFASA